MIWYTVFMKSAQRKKYKEIRKNIKNKEKKDITIFNNVITNVDFEKYDVILTYVSTFEEVDTIKLIEYLFEKNIRIAVPKVEYKTMNFYYIESFKDLKKGYYNILEPTSNNIVDNYSNALCITPGICFSKNGYRIGYGGGYYDKFFFEHSVYSIGLCYKECLVQKIDFDKYDKKVNQIITD